MDIGFRREIAGVHYPSDSAAGRKLAEHMIVALQADSDYQADRAAARKEIAKIWK
jgi:acid phosphatase (class A)